MKKLFGAFGVAAGAAAGYVFFWRRRRGGEPQDGGHEFPAQSGWSSEPAPADAPPQTGAALGAEPATGGLTAAEASLATAPPAATTAGGAAADTDATMVATPPEAGGAPSGWPGGSETSASGPTWEGEPHPVVGAPAEQADQDVREDESRAGDETKYDRALEAETEERQRAAERLKDDPLTSRLERDES